jgi:Ca2+-binding RTX toxin-like protein
MPITIPPSRSPYVYTGTSGDDALYSRFAGAVNESFYGYEGNDYIDGGLGADRMYGGAGHDTYVVDNAGDMVIENAGEGFDTVRVSFSYTIPANVERLELTGTAAINATGSSADDRLYGNVSSNILWGHDGNDILDGREGTDTMVGGIGNDTYYVDNAGDVVVEYANEGTYDWVASTISYTLGHNIENWALLGTGANNGTGNELDNRLHGNGYANVLSGLDGNDHLYGENGDDQLLGGDGNDILDGSFGTDVLTGGTGQDIMNGGTHADRFVFATPAECGLSRAFADQLPDFSAAEGDKIDLSLMDANANVAGNQAFAFIGTNAAYTGAAGELRYLSEGYVEGDVNGDAVSDFFIAVNPALNPVLNGAAFIL